MCTYCKMDLAPSCCILTTRGPSTGSPSRPYPISGSQFPPGRAAVRGPVPALGCLKLFFPELFSSIFLAVHDKSMANTAPDLIVTPRVVCVPHHSIRCLIV